MSYTEKDFEPDEPATIEVRDLRLQAELQRKWKRSERMWTVLGWLTLSGGGLIAAYAGFDNGWWWPLIVGVLLGFGASCFRAAGGADGRYERTRLVSELLAELDATEEPR